MTDYPFEREIILLFRLQPDATVEISLRGNVKADDIDHVLAVMANLRAASAMSIDGELEARLRGSA